MKEAVRIKEASKVKADRERTDVTEIKDDLQEELLVVKQEQKSMQ